MTFGSASQRCVAAFSCQRDCNAATSIVANGTDQVAALERTAHVQAPDTFERVPRGEILRSVTLTVRQALYDEPTAQVAFIAEHFAQRRQRSCKNSIARAGSSCASSAWLSVRHSMAQAVFVERCGGLNHEDRSGGAG